MNRIVNHFSSRLFLGLLLLGVLTLNSRLMRCEAVERSVGSSDEPRANLPALRRAIEDLIATHGAGYSNGAEYLKQVGELEDFAAAGGDIEESFISLQYKALLENPLLDFDQIMLVRRPEKAPVLGLPRNWQGNCELPRKGFDDAICLWSWRGADSGLQTVFEPGGEFVGDVDLHWDGDRILFSMRSDNGRWQVFEQRLGSNELPRQLTGEEPDVDNYDAAYLPNDQIVFSSTAPFIGVPCVNGSSHVANLFVMDSMGRQIRRLCFDQEHNWCPTIMNDGRVLYTRWEYSGLPHSNSRLLFTMNPDGTSQFAYLGGSSYWPNSFFYTRPIPNHPTKVVSIIGGHHDHPRMGELVIFDPQKGRHEGEPVVQRIPGFGEKVEPLIRDGLTLESWPKFLHPWPLSEKYFLVSCKPDPQALWGIYLVDVFDNIVPLKEMPGYALFEPIPHRQSKRPPIIPERVNTDRQDAVVVLQDIYSGDGLRGVPRGKVRSMRVLSYHYAYQNMGGLLGVVGMDGPWDVKRILGTVPVERDGSARFRVPANTPISLQPLDEEGKALQLMRSWMTTMPGETIQCVGCHDRRNSAPPIHATLAMTKPPEEITPWRGPVRGFSYAREVQPVIDRYCVSCHNGESGASGLQIADLRGTEMLKDWDSVTPGNGGYTHAAGKFSVGYAELHRFVRRPGIESECHVLEPMEFHADTTQLVQMLRKGHQGVQLDVEGWDRLITWIDLNAPYHGTWGDGISDLGDQRERRRDLMMRYANVSEDPEVLPAATRIATPMLDKPSEEIKPLLKSVVPQVADWPFDAVEAKRRQRTSDSQVEARINLATALGLDLVRIPSGEFIMGSRKGGSDEQPPTLVRIEEPFWLGRFEITNAQYAAFDPEHDSRIEDKNTYQFGIHGYPANEPEQPVVRVSWEEAMAFCKWLSERTGRRFSLPSESQWEWACRAGSSTAFQFGPRGSDFSNHANFADSKLREFASDPYTVDLPLEGPTAYDDWIPKDVRFNDGSLIAVGGGRYLPNPWGLFDMHGNVAEWTQSIYRPYSWSEDRGAEAVPSDRRVVRGGSWRDRPKRGTSSFRLDYPSWQRIYNVGFRVMCKADGQVARASWGGDHGRLENR